MIQNVQHRSRYVAAVFVAAILLSSCGRANAPRIDLPGAGASNEGTASLVENRAWLTPSGSDELMVAFLSDGTLLSGTCGTPFELSAWRWVSESVLVWDGVDAPVRAEIGSVGPDEMSVIVDPDGTAKPVLFRAARPPVECGTVPAQ